MSAPVELRGSGRVVLAAYGLNDAEHGVEKELTALWPGATVEVLEVAREGSGRIVEEFAVRYRIRGWVDPAGNGEATAAALRQMRSRFQGTRFERIVLEAVPPARRK